MTKRLCHFNVRIKVLQTNEQKKTQKTKPLQITDKNQLTDQHSAHSFYFIFIFPFPFQNSSFTPFPFTLWLTLYPFKHHNVTAVTALSMN